MSNTMMIRVIFSVVLCGGLLYLLSPIMTPFFLGALLAYLGNPIVSYLNKKKVPRVVGVIVVFLVVIIFLSTMVFLVLPAMQEQITVAIQKIPDLLLWIQNKGLPWIGDHVQNHDVMNVASLKKELAQYSQKIGGNTSTLIKAATHSTFALIDFVMNLILVPVVAFYLMRDWPKIMKNIQKVLPMPYRASTINLAYQCDEVVGAFFKGQLLVMLGLAVIYSTGLGFLGLKVAIFVGLLSGLVAIVPYLGFTMGIVIASIAMYCETHAMIKVFEVWGLYAVGQAAESMVLTPLLVGDKIGLHPVAVIFAVLSGGLLFGFLGVLLALPVAAIILVVLKRFLINEETHAART